MTTMPTVVSRWFGRTITMNRKKTIVGITLLVVCYSIPVMGVSGAYGDPDIWETADTIAVAVMALCFVFGWTLTLMGVMEWLDERD
jgi:hypothetical protein